jgi:hypothetical protein
LRRPKAAVYGPTDSPAGESVNRDKEVGLMARKQYFVVPDGTNWQVKHEGQVLSNHVLKTQAIDAGVKVAKANAPSQLKIMRQNGTIEDERTYGDDPFPPRG